MSIQSKLKFLRDFHKSTISVDVSENSIEKDPFLIRKGQEIGNLNDIDLLQQRENWSLNHDCLKDPICSKFCMDFKCDFNHASEKKNES